MVEFGVGAVTNRKVVGSFAAVSGDDSAFSRNEHKESFCGGRDVKSGRHVRLTNSTSCVSRLSIKCGSPASHSLRASIACHSDE
jgi:hypothetical protein